jgi:cell division protease FtsH
MTTTQDRRPPQKQPPRQGWQRWIVPVGLLLVLLLVRAGQIGPRPASYTYTQFVTAVDAGQVKQISVNDAGAVTGVLTDGKDFVTQLPTALGNAGLAQDLQAHHVAIAATTSGFSWLSLLISLVPWILLIGLFLWIGQRASRGLSGLGGFGRARTKVVDTERPTTRFADVAGYAGAKREVEEVVDYLRDPGRYRLVGATGPRGVLLVGPPGTGKTLLARSVAGEASVPFLSVSGSGFIEMFVGVGASRVRDLFTEARRRAPAIVFIDEIDAIGGRRQGAALGGNDEREQTLNQLLAEMDGFEEAAGVVVMAATNRPDRLDAALLRPGRFDRQIVVALPAQADRTAILAVHANGKPIAPTVDLSVMRVPRQASPEPTWPTSSTKPRSTRFVKAETRSQQWTPPATAFCSATARTRTCCCRRRKSRWQYTRPVTPSSPRCHRTPTPSRR